MSIVLVAAICGLLYYGGTSKLGYHLTTAIGSPIFIGFVLGMIYGQGCTGTSDWSNDSAGVPWGNCYWW